MTKTATTASEAVEQATVRTAARAAQMIESTQGAANGALNTLQSGVDTLRETVPSAFSGAAAQVEDLTRRGLERARQASHQVRDTVAHASDRTVGYIKDEPVKSVLIAAVAGAALASLIGWVARSRSRP